MFTFQGGNSHGHCKHGTPRILVNKDDQTQWHRDMQTLDLQSRRAEMTKFIAAITLSLFGAVALADDPCMDANVSPLGYYDAPTADELHLDEHGC